MTPPIMRTLISLSLNKSSHLRKPFSCHSISVAFFSSSSTQESKLSLSLADYFVKKHNYSPELALRAASSLKSARAPDEFDNIISFLKQSGFSNSHIEEAVKRKPTLLCSSLEKIIKPKFKVFQELGFSTDEFAKLASVDPWILTRSMNVIASSISYLKSVLGSNANVIKAVTTTSWFLRSDLQKTMKTNIELLRSCGINSAQIVSYVFYFPRFFVLKPESIKQFVKRADDMGLDRKSNMYIAAIRMLSSMSEENWELKLKLFRRLGFSEDDIMATFMKTPQVFSISERKIKQVTEFLLGSKNIDISLIIKRPQVLYFSLEHRLKPRFQVFEILGSKNLLSRKVRLWTIFNMSHKKFEEKYIHPYSAELKKAAEATWAHNC